jgi:hypothetical protein
MATFTKVNTLLIYTCSRISGAPCREAALLVLEPNTSNIQNRSRVLRFTVARTWVKLVYSADSALCARGSPQLNHEEAFADPINRRMHDIFLLYLCPSRESTT